MPKIPYKRISPASTSSPPIPLKFVAAELETIRADLFDMLKRLDHLYVSLFTVGLDGKGPIVEDRDDSPF